MTITNTVAPWLLLIFSLPAKRASQRVEVWRKLQRYGALALRNSGYLLPNNPTNRERFEWLATAIRNYKGEASVIEVQAIDNLSPKELASRFIEARARDYQALLRDLARVPRTISKQFTGQLTRLRRRYQEIFEIDFFHCPLRERVEELLQRAEGSVSEPRRPTGRLSKRDYHNKLWLTRPRPEIDRVGSAWLIRRFIDPKARFVFAPDPSNYPSAIPFDMFKGGFGHCGEDCTFETLAKDFRIRDRRVGVISQIVHDADLCDEKYGRRGGFGLDQVLKGWAKQGVADAEILKRGTEMMEGLYESFSR